MFSPFAVCGDKLVSYCRTLSLPFYIVEEQLREIRNDLPKAYYEELPKLSVRELAVYPRIYAVALALIAHTDSRLDVTTIRAIAITLRLALVENIRRVTLRVIWDRQQKNKPMS